MIEHSPPVEIRGVTNPVKVSIEVRVMGLKIQSPETDFFRLVTPAWNWTEMSGRMNDVAGRSTCLQLVQKALEFIPIQSFSQGRLWGRKRNPLLWFVTNDKKLTGLNAPPTQSLVNYYWVHTTMCGHQGILSNTNEHLPQK